MPSPEFHETHTEADASNTPRSDHLSQHEIQLMDYLDGQLSATQSDAIEAHLTTCVECRSTLHEWQQLDAELALAIKGPSLSSDFGSRLRHLIEREPAPSAAGADLKAHLETELRQIWADYRKCFLRTQLPTLLDRLGYGTLAAIGTALFWRLLTRLPEALTATLNGSLEQLLFPIGCGVGFIVLLGSLAFAVNPRFIRWFHEL